jgi:Transcriptional regulator
MLSALKNFAITFLVAAILFGVTASLVCGFILNTVTPFIDGVVPNDGLESVFDKQTDDPTVTENPDDPGGDEEKTEPIEGTSFNILIVGTNYYPEIFEDYVLDKADEYIIKVHEDYLEYLKELEENPPETEPLPEPEPEPEPEIDESLLGEEELAALYALREEEAAAKEAEERERERKKDMGFLKRNYDRITADTITLVRIDKEARQCTFTTIPSNTQIYVNNAFTTIGTLYYKYGIDYLVNKITAITGLGIDFYSIINVTETPKIIEALEGVEFSVPEDIYLLNGKYKSGTSLETEENPEGAELIIKSGVREITPENVIPLLAFGDYTDGAAGKTNAHLAFLKAVFEKMTDPAKIDGAEELYTTILEAVHSTFTIEDLIAEIELVFAYGDFESVNLMYPGKVRPSDSVFVPDTRAAFNLFKPYRGDSHKRAADRKNDGESVGIPDDPSSVGVFS